MIQVRRVHVSILMALIDIAGVQSVILLSKTWLAAFYRKVPVFTHYSLLALAHFVDSKRNSYRDACLAIFTMGAIDMLATAPEAQI